MSCINSVVAAAQGIGDMAERFYLKVLVNKTLVLRRRHTVPGKPFSWRNRFIIILNPPYDKGISAEVEQFVLYLTFQAGLPNAHGLRKT